MKAVLCGGGFGGHVTMAVAIGQALRARGVAQIDYLGCSDYVEQRIISKETDFPFHPIKVSAIPTHRPVDGESMLAGYAQAGGRTGSPPHILLRQLWWPARLMLATTQSLRHLRSLRPDVVVSTGAVVSAPVIAAARVLRIPVLIHEANEIPGLVNRAFSRSAKVVTTGWGGTRELLGKHAIVTGNPVRLGFEHPYDAEAARRRLGLEPHRRTLFVTGGSLGAPPLNRVVAAAARRLITELDVQILHQTGDEDFEAHLSRTEAGLGDLAKEPHYHAVPYVDDFLAALSAADLIVTRAGAATLAEIESVGRQAILVPFAGARADHQSHNAREAVRRGIGTILPESRLTAENLFEEVAGQLRTSGGRALPSAIGVRAAGRIAELAMSMAPQGGGARERRLAIVVAADLGRSPRLIEHALALSSLGVEVDLVGFDGKELPVEVAESGIRVHRAPPVGEGLPRGGGTGSLVRAAVRAVLQTARLARLIVRVGSPAAFLCATPPPIPTLALVALTARIRRARFVIDWHNDGASLLALKLGVRHPLVRLTRRVEAMFGRRAEAHLCVSNALRERLRTDFDFADPLVIYDCPAERFGASAKGRWRRRPGTGRPVALLAVPTGWTLDEDPCDLLQSLAEYDRIAAEDPELPELDVVVSGDGPLRGQFEEELQRTSLERVTVTTGWLAIDDYVSLLMDADLGVSLHRSSSGVDLAMKVADMQGAGLPVCAYDYGPCLREQMEPGNDAMLFEAKRSLSTTLQLLLRGFPEDSCELRVLERRIATMERRSWREQWRAAMPAVLGISPRAIEVVDDRPLTGPAPRSRARS